jgi:hypothetical protein
MAGSACLPDRLAVRRIALRQTKSQGHASAALSAWLASFDQAAPDDETALHHEGRFDKKVRLFRPKITSFAPRSVVNRPKTARRYLS